ncbi:unnamed protein product [Chondrus crispus]|uniref:Uncharacterized protein n=1 Tax=Chondrus crispus TaxID=2769 RepID=R7Q5D7_CHOCR|nr:unnamed protein product [Chondrus crispus]CDF33239.1 unnamed protein product [Chondrus crispus]|eukprot:XP_005713041.1 unnamed protein product [Chondrus crispus]
MKFGLAQMVTGCGNWGAERLVEMAYEGLTWASLHRFGEEVEQ